MDPIISIVSAKTHIPSAVQFKGVIDADGTFEGFPTREDPSRNPTEIAVLVPTANGGTPAFPGDWIVSNADGQLSVVSNSYFITHYKSSVSSEPIPAALAAPAVPAVRPASRLTPQQIAGRQAAAAAAKQAAEDAAQKAEAAKNMME